MLFSSPRFFAFLAVLLLFLALPLGLRAKKNFLVVASSVFYAAWDWRYLGLLALISIIDYVAAERIHASAIGHRRKSWVTFSVVSNLAILGYFKYCNFFLDNLNNLFGLSLPFQEILLPAGISFYTFKSMSYTIDVYRRHIEPCPNYLDYAMFITFFPELIAGPIVRASVFLPQMARPPGPSWERLRIGFGFFALGLLKKRVIADHLSAFVDPIFAAPEVYSATSMWLAVLAYALQIYCDFSGYTDMAIGCAKMIGYDLPENFLMPYLSPNITVFWRRWHMTLSFWLRDYLYIPLGGNRKGVARQYLNLFLTMLLGGLWHGASWNFVLWGALHGGALAFHKKWLDWFPKGAMPTPFAIALTFLFACLCWIPFRAPSFATSIAIFRRLFTPGAGAYYVAPSVLGLALLVGIGHAIGWLLLRQHPLGARVLKGLGVRLERSPISGMSFSFAGGSMRAWFFLTLFVTFVWWTAVLQSSPFIYFQF